MSDTPCERIRKMMQDADDNNVPAHHRPGLVMSLLRQFGDELAAMTARAELAERERDYAIERAKSAHLERDSTARQGERDMVRANLREFEIIDARKAKELAERQVGEMASHIANNVPCWFCPLANADGDCGAGTCVAKVCAWSRAEAAKGGA